MDLDLLLDQPHSRAFLIGTFATAFMDAWLFALKRVGIPTLDFALLGRWVGHMGRGAWRHPAIARAEPVRHETGLGWLAHYATGIAFASILVALAGPEWTGDPTWGPALAMGVATVAAPWLLMQPAMGAGIAACRTPNPLVNRIRSLANHTVFGIGLYLAAVFIERILK